MAGYYAGTAANFAALQAAIESALSTEGWALTSGVLSNGVGYFKLASAANYLAVSAGTGQSGSTLTGAAPAEVRIASFSLADPITWPINYEIHVSDSPDEVYAVINYNGDRYQVLAWGVSPAPGNPVGIWINGTGGPSNNYDHASTGYNWEANTGFPTDTGNAAPMSGAGNNAHAVSAGVMASFPWATAGRRSYHLHDGDGWQPAATASGVVDGSCSGAAYAMGLLQSLPSVANQATVLLPAYVLHYRVNFRAIPVLQLGHLRHTRIDNYDPGAVVAYGPDKWKLYPQARKNAAVRTPGDSGATGFRNHTGTFGYAVRYHGP